MALAVEREIRSHYELPTGYLSPSQINEYRDCAYCYYLHRVKRQPKPDTIHFAIGGGVHKAIETVGRAILANRDPDPDEAVTRGMEDYEERLKNPVDDDGHPVELEIDWGKFENDRGKAKDDTHRYVKLVVGRFPKLLRERGLVAVEQQLVTDESLLLPHEEGLLAEGFPFPFKGRLDQLYGTSLEAVTGMTDTKTASRRGGPDENGKLQFVLYALPSITAGSPWRIGTDTVLKQVAADIETRWANGDGFLTEENIEWGYNVALDVAERISRGDFPHGKGWNGRHGYDHGEPEFQLAVSGFGDA